MNFKNFIYISLLFNTIVSIYGQSKQIKINGNHFLFVNENIDTLDEARKEVLNLYRGDKKLLSHIIVEQEGDCSSLSIQLGNYKIIGNKIIFYSYWATTDRMPNSILKYGFSKQTYTVNSSGLLNLKESKIYIEDYVESQNKNFFEENGWKHKGLKYLNNTPKNKSEKRYLNDYIKNIESKYNAEFMLNSNKKLLENEVRMELKSEIQNYTKDWIEGEVYGNVKK